MSSKKAKKVRKEVSKLKYKLAGELKGYINSLSFWKRVSLGLKIMFKRRTW